jgi:hypothetical protein
MLFIITEIFVISVYSDGGGRDVHVTFRGGRKLLKFGTSGLVTENAS